MQLSVLVYSWNCATYITLWFQKIFITSKRNLTLTSGHSLPSQYQATTNLLPVPVHLPLWDSSYKWKSYRMWPLVSGFFFLISLNVCLTSHCEWEYSFILELSNAFICLLEKKEDSFNFKIINKIS